MTAEDRSDHDQAALSRERRWRELCELQREVERCDGLIAGALGALSDARRRRDEAVGRREALARDLLRGGGGEGEEVAAPPSPPPEPATAYVCRYCGATRLRMTDPCPSCKGGVFTPPPPAAPVTPEMEAPPSGQDKEQEAPEKPAKKPRQRRKPSGEKGGGVSAPASAEASAPPPAAATACVRIECRADGWCYLDDPAHAEAAAKALGMLSGAGAPFCFAFGGLEQRLKQLEAAGLAVDLLPPARPHGSDSDSGQRQVCDAAKRAGVRNVVVLPAPEAPPPADGPLFATDADGATVFGGGTGTGTLFGADVPTPQTEGA